MTPWEGYKGIVVPSFDHPYLGKVSRFRCSDAILRDPVAENEGGVARFHGAHAVGCLHLRRCR